MYIYIYIYIYTYIYIYIYICILGRTCLSARRRAVGLWRLSCSALMLAGSEIERRFWRLRYMEEMAGLFGSLSGTSVCRTGNTRGRTSADTTPSCGYHQRQATHV